ncbi:uncharacterized protein [Littorina saxatilis]|uniref:uncharacterized protein isoform X2 n=1 Tax=Littorina saxatilis TaxID=31220 RepID=UPI0038B60652
MLRYARLSLRKLVIYVVVVAHYLLIYSLWTDTAHHRCPVEVTSDHRQRRSDVRSVLSGEENALNSASNSSAEVHSHFQKEAPKSGQARNGKESLKNVVKDHSVLKKQGTKESNSIRSDSSQTLVSVKTKTAEKDQNGVKMTPKRTAEKGNQSLPKDTHGKLLVTANNTITPRPLNCSGCFRSEFPTLLDQPELCRVYDNQSIDVVFLIATAGTHTAERHAIRNTWATATNNNTSNIRHLFVLGTTTDAKRMRAIEEEGRHFRDVVVSGFHDSYLNLTLKTVASLRWLTSRCAHARFFVKVDDDVWVNSRAVQHVLTNHTDFLQRGLGGHCASANKPNRYKSKWFVPMLWF